MNTERPKILVADEDKDVRFLIKVYLRDYDAQIIEAKDGDECYDLIKKERPRLVILNFMLDKIDGYEVAGRVSRDDSLKHIPVIMMTIEGFDLIEEKAGVTDYLAKPFSRKQFMDLIKKILGKEFAEYKKLEKTAGVLRQETAGETALEKKPGKKKVLVADDEPYVIKLLIVLLERDYDVEAATTGEELVRMVEKEDYDLIITDVIMPRMSGWKSIKKIRELGYDTPVIFNSGLVKDKELYETLKPEGPSRFILKPFKSEELFFQIKELL
jgi:CheY-like chemotaxis protein